MVSGLCFRSWSWCKFLSRWVSQPCKSYKPSWPPRSLRSYDACSTCRALFQCGQCASRPCQKVPFSLPFKLETSRSGSFPTV